MRHPPLVRRVLPLALAAAVLSGCSLLSILPSRGGLERPVAARFSPDGRALYLVDFGVMTIGESPQPRPAGARRARLRRELLAVPPRGRGRAGAGHQQQAAPRLADEVPGAVRAREDALFSREEISGEELDALVRYLAWLRRQR